MHAACSSFCYPKKNLEVWPPPRRAGLPIDASSVIGCACGLVGRNGHTFAPGDVAGLADALRSVLTSPELRRPMGAASREIIQRATPNVDCARHSRVLALVPLKRRRRLNDRIAAEE